MKIEITRETAEQIANVAGNGITAEKVLKAINFECIRHPAATAIADSLVYNLGLSYEKVALILKSYLGFSFEEIANALAYGLYMFDSKVARTLKTVFDLPDQDIARALRDGIGLNEKGVADALKYGINVDLEEDFSY